MKRSSSQRDTPSIGTNDTSQHTKKQRRREGGVTFDDAPKIREFDAEEDDRLKDDDTGDLVGARIVGEKITSVEGEEDADEWSDDEKQDIAIEPFNLKQEQEEGYFDVTGHYVENKFSKGVADAWLDEYDEKWAKQMRGKEKSSQPQGAEEALEVVDKKSLKQKVLSFLNEKENVLAALRRYSGKGSKKSDRDMTKFNELTECADTLLSEGDSRERIQAEIREDELAEPELAQQATNGVGEASAATEEAMWEYKLKDGTTFGPYTSRDMASWSQQGYFSADSGALVRRAQKTEESLFEDDDNENESQFVPSHTIDFTSFL